MLKFILSFLATLWANEKVRSIVKSGGLTLTGIAAAALAGLIANLDTQWLVAVTALTPFVINALLKLYPSDGDDSNGDSLNDYVQTAVKNFEQRLKSGSITPEEARKANKWIDDLLKKTPLIMLCGLPFLLAGCDYTGPTQAPRVVISGPTTGVPGELLLLDASATENSPQHFRWTISPALPGRQQLIVQDGGKRCFVAGYPGSFVVTCSASNRAGVDTLTHAITTPGTPPGPPPAPIVPKPEPTPNITPQPRPEPPTPPTPAPEPIAKTFGIGPAITDVARSINSPDRSATCRRLASEARRVAEDKNLKTQAAILTAAMKPIGALGSEWQPLKDLLKSQITKLYGDGKLVTNDDYIALLYEVAKALDAAA